MSYLKIGTILANKNNLEMISKTFLHYGIVTINIENSQNFTNILKENKCNLVMIDLDLPNQEAFNILNKMKEDEDLKNIYLIGTSINTSEQFIKKMQNYHFICFITKPMEQTVFDEKCKMLLEKFKDHFPDRKHIRITPAQDDFVRISFKLKNKKNISAKVLNISMGGLACLMYTNYNDQELLVGKLIEHIIFEVNNKEIDVDAKIVSKKDKFLGFLFTHFYNDSNKNLAGYIINKISI